MTDFYELVKPLMDFLKESSSLNSKIEITKSEASFTRDGFVLVYKEGKSIKNDKAQSLKNAYDLIKEPSNTEELSDDYFYDMLYYISVHILDERLKRNMAEKEFGELFGVSPNEVSEWESGNYNFSLKEFCGICAKLNIKPYICFSQKGGNRNERNKK